MGEHAKEGVFCLRVKCMPESLMLLLQFNGESTMKSVTVKKGALLADYFSYTVSIHKHI